MGPRGASLPLLKLVKIEGHVWPKVSRSSRSRNLSEGGGGAMTHETCIPRQRPSTFWLVLTEAGGPGPRGPPLGSATAASYRHPLSNFLISFCQYDLMIILSSCEPFKRVVSLLTDMLTSCIRSRDGTVNFQEVNRKLSYLLDPFVPSEIFHNKHWHRFSCRSFTLNEQSTVRQEIIFCRFLICNIRNEHLPNRLWQRKSLG